MSSSSRHSLALGSTERGPDQGKLWGCVALRDHEKSKDWPRGNATSRDSAEREPKDGVVPSRNRRNSNRLGRRRTIVRKRRAEFKERPGEEEYIRGNKTDQVTGAITGIDLTDCWPEAGITGHPMSNAKSYSRLGHRAALDRFGLGGEMMPDWEIYKYLSVADREKDH